MDLKRFNRFYTAFALSGFTDAELSMIMSDFLYENCVKIFEKGDSIYGGEVHAFIALKQGRFTFGNVCFGSILIPNPEPDKLTLITSIPPKIIQREQLTESSRPFGIWMPLLSGPDLYEAVKGRDDDFKRHFERWQEERERALA